MYFVWRMITAFVQKGFLKIRSPDGVIHEFGTAGELPYLSIEFSSWAVLRRVIYSPELAITEGIMDGNVLFHDKTGPDDLMGLYMVNQRNLDSFAWTRFLETLSRQFRFFQQYNPLGQAAKHAKYHYDLGEEFYRLFLDEDLVYSCAYWFDPDRESLEQAQQNKFRHIAAKLNIEPGMRILDIGSGWGSLGIYFAKNFDVHVTGINVAPEQLATSVSRAQAAGVADRTEFVEKDYRLLSGEYDRIVSVGMFEHVGIKYYDGYFDVIGRVLAPGGIALVHSIGRILQPSVTSPFIRRHIFPGGYTPSLSEVLAATERNALWVGDVEILRVHYADTIREWKRRFRAARGEVLRLYDERFVRMWELYLAGVEAGFRYGSVMVFQMLLANERADIPLVRDYITDAERVMMDNESGARSTHAATG